MQALNVKEDAAALSAVTAPLQLRGRSFTALVLKVIGAVDARFFGALDALMRQAPHFFVNAPLVIDVAQAEGLHSKVDFLKLVRELRARRLAAIGIQNGTIEQGNAAFGAGLISMHGGREAPAEPSGRPVAVTAQAHEPEPAPTLHITEPVRSGQRIFADRGDLIVSAAVSSGAELVAHGNIHVYGPLRGRALAGINGDRTARIFCQSLEADLIAIAGLYLTSEDLDPAVRQQRVQAFLQDDALCVQPIK